MIYRGWNFLQYIDYHRITVSQYIILGKISWVSYREVPGDTQP